MNVTKNLVFCILIGAGIIFVAGLAGTLFAVLSFVMVNIIILGLYITDLNNTPSPSLIRAERQMEKKLSLATENKVQIIVRNDSDIGLKIQIRDDVPAYFTHNQNELIHWIPAHGQCVVEYTVIPQKRGSYNFPCINFRYTGVYGFCTRSGKIKTDSEYKVYPDMKALSKYGVSALSKSLFIHGIKRVKKISENGEFDSLREYNIGDPMKIVNWAATARRHQLIVNSYVPERNQFIYILLDSSRIMNGEYQNIKKLDYCINAGFLLADYCIRGGDNVGLEVFDNKIRRYLPADKGQNQFSKMAEELYNIEETESSADYSGAFSYLASFQRRRALIFIFTELFNADEAIRFSKAVNDNLKNHLVYTITIKDPRLEDMAKRNSQNAGDAFIKSAAVKINRERKKIKGILNNNGIMNSDIEPDKLSLEAVARYLEIKNSGVL